MKYVSLVLLGLLMVVLAGCSSGGDGGKSDLISTLEADLALVQADLEAAQDELATTEANLKEKEGELTTTQGELTTTQGELTTTQGELTTTQGELTTTQGELTTTQGELTTTQGELTTTQGELTTTQGELTTTQGELTTTQGELTTTQGELTTTQETLTTTQETLTTTKTNLETAQGDLTDKEQAVNTLLLKAGVETLAALSTKLDADGQAYTTLQAQVAGLLTKAGVETLAALSIKLDADGQAYTTLQAQVAGLLLKAGVDDLTALSTKLDADGQAYTTLQGELQTVLAATGAADLTALQTAYNTAKTNYDTLNTQVQAALTATNSANLTALQTAYNTAKTNYDTLNTQVRAMLTATGATSLTNLQVTVASLRSQVVTLQTRLGTANQQAQEAQTETNTLSQQVEANTRGRALLKALGELEATDTTSPVFGDPDIAPRAKISATGTALKLEASPLTGGTSSVSGNFKGSKATLTRTVPGSGVKQRMVVYTDREVSRTFANHFGEFIVDRTASKLRFDPDGPDSGSRWWAASENMLATTGETNNIGRTVSNISHGLRKPASSAYPDGGNMDDPIDAVPPTTPKKSISASVLGVSGTFVCDNAGTACDINVAGTYYRSDHSDRALRSKLATLTLAPDGGNLYFQPSNASISLRGNLKVGDTTHTDLVDTQYMVFGWWQSIPRDADGTYGVDIFAYDLPDGNDLTVDETGYRGTAEYEGPAAGIYVEERFTTEEEFGGVRQSIAESGEFTATVNLRADFWH